MADVFSRGQIAFIQEQGAFDVIPNSTGAATVANADACLITTMTTEALQAEIKRTDKTGSLDETVAQAGRRIASVNVSLSMAGNGSAGVEPDCKKMLKGIFGAAPTIVGGTSVTYPLGDSLYYLALWNFIRGVASATQMVAFNVLMQKMVATFGGDVPMLQFTGQSGWVLDSNQMADGATPTAAKGGLTAWPSIPSAPVVNGTHPQGFKIGAAIDSNTHTNITSVTVSLEVMRELLTTGNTEFPGAGAAGDRVVTFDWSMADNDSSALATLKQKAYTRTAVPIVFQVQGAVGNIWTFTGANVIVPKPTYTDQGTRRIVEFKGAHAYPSSINAKDHLTVAIT